MMHGYFWARVQNADKALVLHKQSFHKIASQAIL